MNEASHSASHRRVSTLVSSIKESATLAVDAKAKALKAAGKPVISFGAGEPDFPTPEFIVEAAVEAAKDPKNHHYSATGGLPELKEAIAQTSLRNNSYTVDPAQIVVTNGGKQAVYEAFLTLLDPGDEVLLPTPNWTTYPEAIRLARGVPVSVFAGEDQGYRVTVEQLEEALTPRTKALLFSSPTNPTGAVYTPEETTNIGKWAAAKGLWVITDEIYDHLVYDDIPFTSIASAAPELGDKVIILNGVAKTYAMTGWRVGWIIAPRDIAKGATNLQSHLSSNVSNVSQRAAIAALTGPTEAVETMKAAFNRRRQTITKELNRIPGIEAPLPLGAFYSYPSVKGVLGTTLAGKTPRTSLELADLILENTEVAVVPGEAFGPSGYLRLSYALSDDDLAEGLRRIGDFISSAE